MAEKSHLAGTLGSGYAQQCDLSGGSVTGNLGGYPAQAMWMARKSGRSRKRAMAEMVRVARSCGPASRSRGFL